MRIKNSFKIAISSLQVHKSRSALTILGIVIGISSIILIMSIGQGAEMLIVGELGGLGAETVVVRPGKEPTGPADFADTLFAESIREREVEALRKKSNVPELVQIAPAVIVSGSVSYQGETYRPTTFGWSAEFMGEMMDVYPEKGVYFTDEDIRQRAAVAVIGSKVKTELFGTSDALGENIKIKNKNFRVVGILPKKGQIAFFNVDDSIIIPYTTSQDITGISHYHEVMIQTTSAEAVARTVSDVEVTLRELHGITDPKDDDFFVETQQGIVDQVSSIIGILTAFLAMVVAIALVVGGIGVMNIMLVSVTERTREIGLRKALGATEKDILQQFLIEAVVLTATGGAIGILIGTFFSMVASLGLSAYLAVSWEFSFPIIAALLGIGVSGLVGLVFGIYPARQAARKSPIEALRYE